MLPSMGHHANLGASSSGIISAHSPPPPAHARAGMHTKMPLVRPCAMEILWHQVEMDSVTSITAPGAGTCSQRKGDAGHSIERTEKVDMDALLALLRHDGVDSATKAQLQRMNRGLRNGNSFTVTYSKANKLGLGRFYADKGLGLQMLFWDIRNALCMKLVHDVDMVNAHPIILLYLARKHGWVCSFLKRLCEDREEILRSIAEAYGVDRDDSKVAILRLLYLGGLPVDHKFACLETQLPQTLSGPGTADTLAFMEGLKAELLSLSANIVAAYPAEAKEAARMRKAKKNKVIGHRNAPGGHRGRESDAGGSGEGAGGAQARGHHADLRRAACEETRG
eukprot:GHUV01009267.1.p1 GENE.GHUV01009267.1~~GHUV01009267.1.p1  ORF type:complete len:337 (+),score=56.83 GHUV01009267.1:113-1123(+)